MPDGSYSKKPWQTNLWLGMLLFIISEAFLFGSLFWTYFYLRAKATIWPPQGVHLEMLLASINTVILLSSSGTMHWAAAAIRRGDRGRLIAGLLVTFVLGSIFLVIKGWEWVHAGFRPWDHAYGSIFFTLTGFHGLHVLGGLFILLALIIRGLRGRMHGTQSTLAVEVGGLYWHFVDLVWIFVFTSIFLIR